MKRGLLILGYSIVFTFVQALGEIIDTSHICSSLNLCRQISIFKMGTDRFSKTCKQRCIIFRLPAVKQLGPADRLRWADPFYLPLNKGFFFDDLNHIIGGADLINKP